MSGNWKKLIASGSQAELTSITASIGFSGSNLNPLLSFNGNRPISNADFLGTVYNKNFNVEGDLTDFIEAVFFTNKAPELSPSVQVFELNDLTSAGHIVGTISATDEDSVVNQGTITFSIGSESQFESLTSNSTDNFFSNILFFNFYLFINQRRQLLSCLIQSVDWIPWHIPLVTF